MSDPVLKASVTVTVEMTEEQLVAYGEKYGAGFAAVEIRNRLRGEVEMSLREDGDARWFRFLLGNATVTVKKAEGCQP